MFILGLRGLMLIEKIARQKPSFAEITRFVIVDGGDRLFDFF